MAKTTIDPRLKQYTTSRCQLVPLLYLLLTLLVSLTNAQQGDECPRDWVEYNDICYKFSRDVQTVQLASIQCQQKYASLASIKTAGEHTFIQGMLSSISVQREQKWFTSGYRAPDGRLRWSSDLTLINPDFFTSGNVRDAKKKDTQLNLLYDKIVYKFDTQNRKYVWDWGRLMEPGRYICQIEKSETWRIYQQERDFSFGTGITDPREWTTGPNITYQSQNTLYFSTGGGMTKVVLDCQASGNPRPTYRWFRRKYGQSSQTELTSALDAKYVITNGRLTITTPDPVEDSALFICEATNNIGTVQANPIELSYGNVGEFSNVQVSATPAKMYYGVEIPCQQIVSDTDLAYNWNRGTVRDFIRPNLNPQYFLSKNGRLYISEVQIEDQGEYRCIADMVPQQGQVLAANQPQSRISMPIRVNVQGENANTYGPDIQDRFPQIFPKIPLVGNIVEMECLAYGRLPLFYTWRREGAPLNPDYRLYDHGRRLVIPNAILEDTGIYTCIVQGRSTTAVKQAYLTLRARPSFPIPFKNQHLDVDSNFVWRCDAIAVPQPTYTWFKNGQRLVSDTNTGITVTSNVLTISKVTKQHEGMYECQAQNSIGTARTSAQLRTLSFAPTFATKPVASSRQGAEGGDVTIACHPMAAPRATIRWEKNGAVVGDVMPNGDLQLTKLTLGSAGTYTCVATNAHGEARSNSVLTIQTQSIFTEQPSDYDALVNETVQLPCKASFDRSKSDIVYTWLFNEHVIDLEGRINDMDRVYYSTPFTVDREDGVLYITGVQYKHEGVYTCRVTSVTGSISAEGYLTVKGPPGEPGGVHARGYSTEKEFEGKLELWWQRGAHHGFDVSYYVIEYRSFYDPEDTWFVLKDDLKESDTGIEAYPNWRGYMIDGGLSPATPYHFRIRACSSMIGCSPPSNGPYTYYKMASAQPVFAPQNVGGGGGTEGILQMTWNNLERSKWGGNSLSYILYFRKKDTSSRLNQWRKIATNSNYYNSYVGKQNYYLPYELKVQAKNEKGEGPNSTIAIAYSAELLPNKIPRNIATNTINGTAGIVTWTGVPNTREEAMGVIAGYQINYWNEGNTLCDGIYETNAQSINIYGDVETGTLVGMIPGGDYCVNVQMYNMAGLGPKTNNYYLGMNDRPPSMYPEYITVQSHGSESVRLTWDGVFNFFGEEPIQGYRAWWWEVTENMKSARIQDFKKTFTGVLHGVERDQIYRLRMMAYNKGGDGTKSPEVYFTLGGQLRVDPLTTEIMNSAPTRHSVTSLIYTLILSMFMYCIVVTHN